MRQVEIIKQYIYYIYIYIYINVSFISYFIYISLTIVHISMPLLLIQQSYLISSGVQLRREPGEQPTIPPQRHRGSQIHDLPKLREKLSLRP